MKKVQAQINKGIKKDNRTVRSWASSWITNNNSNDKLSQEWTIKDKDEYMDIIKKLEQLYSQLPYSYVLTHEAVDANQKTALLYQM